MYAQDQDSTDHANEHCYIFIYSDQSNSCNHRIQHMESNRDTIMTFVLPDGAKCCSQYCKTCSYCSFWWFNFFPTCLQKCKKWKFLTACAYFCSFFLLMYNCISSVNPDYVFILGINPFHDWKQYGFCCWVILFSGRNTTSNFLWLWCCFGNMITWTRPVCFCSFWRTALLPIWFLFDVVPKPESHSSSSFKRKSNKQRKQRHEYNKYLYFVIISTRTVSHWRECRLRQ